jgi:Polyphosphate kinase 2 (PPK2)
MGYRVSSYCRPAYENIEPVTILKGPSAPLLYSDGIRIAKCFLHIAPAEQLRRFKDRLANPLKRWKLSYEDFRNRSRWAEYEVATEDMMRKTSPKWVVCTPFERTGSWLR